MASEAGKGRRVHFRWDSFAQWTGQNRPGVGSGHLLQDSTNARSFLSFGTWDNEDAIQGWRQTPQFQSFLAVARELCEEIQPRTLKLVALSIPKGQDRYTEGIVARLLGCLTTQWSRPS